MVVTAHMTRGTTAHVIRERLLQDFMQGRFLPGMRLDMDALAKRYAVSRTPIREALLLLASDGFVISGNYGFEVRAPSFDEMCEMYNIRRSLECLAIEELVAKGVPPELLRQLRENLAAQKAQNPADYKLRTQLDQRFHELICDNCGSPMLSQLMRRNLVFSTIFNYVTLYMPTIRKSSKTVMRGLCLQHERILAGLEAQDAKKAGKAMFKHLMNARRFFELHASY